MSGECVRDVDRGYQLIFGENIGIGVASGGDREDSVRLNSVPFCIVCEKLDITDEERDNFNLTVPHIGEGRVGFGVVGRSGSGIKVEKYAWIAQIEHRCASD